MMGDEQDLHILGVIMMKYSFKKGLHKFAKKKGSMTKELTQLHAMMTFITMYPDRIMKEQHVSEIAFIIFLKEKEVMK